METALTTTDQRPKLPAVPLPPQFQTQLMSDLQAGFSIKTARKLAAMPGDQLLALTEKWQSTLSQSLSRDVCDKCLRRLALTLPHAAVTPRDAHDMLDEYHRLLSAAGVTDKMLDEATDRYIVAPPPPKGKFFPDPGQIIVLCRDDVRARQLQRSALVKAQRTLLDSAGAQDGTEAPRTFRKASEILAERGLSMPAGLSEQPEPMPHISREETPESLAALARGLQERMARA